MINVEGQINTQKLIFEKHFMNLATNFITILWANNIFIFNFHFDNNSTNDHTCCSYSEN